MIKFNVQKIKCTLNSKPYRDRIVDEFNLRGLSEEGDICCGVLDLMNQRSNDNPLESTHANNQIFEAAVKAIGSNSRKWTKFLAIEKSLRDLLCKYDPQNTAKMQREILEETAAKLLSGQTAKSDARAIVSWARVLTENEQYSSKLADAVHNFQHKAQKCKSHPLSNPELMLCLAATLARPPSNSSLEKAPGMGYILASEFLRNLGWPGFKPDRHVRRLLRQWCPDVIDQQSDAADRLAKLVGSRSKELKEFFRYSLAGIALTPDGIDPSHMDNLIWLLGAYVEKRGRETDTCYLC